MSTTSRLEINKTDRAVLFVCSATLALLAFIVFIISIFYHQNTYADSIPVNLRISPALEISTSTNSVSLNPEVGNNTPDTGDVDVIVSTNAPNGYTLLAHMTGGDSGPSISGNYDQGCLKNILYANENCADIPSQNKINPNLSTSLAFNTWGLSLDGGSTYLPFSWHEQTYSDLQLAMYAYCDIVSLMGNMPSLSSCLIEIESIFRDRWDEIGPEIAGYVGGETDDQKAALLMPFLNAQLQFMQEECGLDSEAFAACSEILSMSPYTFQSIVDKYNLNGASYWRVDPLRTTSANSVNSITTVTFGTKVDFSVIAGAYANVITFTAIANPSPEPLITNVGYDNYDSGFGGYRTIYITGIQLDALQSIELYDEPGTITCELGTNLVINSPTSATCTDPMGDIQNYYRPISGHCGAGVAGYWSVYGTYIPRVASDKLC